MIGQRTNATKMTISKKLKVSMMIMFQKEVKDITHLEKFFNDSR